MQRLIDANECPCRNCEKSYCSLNCNKFYDWLENPAEVAPVAHGHWKLRFGDLECSECGHTGYETPYCAYCGAKMY